MRINVSKPINFGETHEGAPAKRMTDHEALRRSVMSCLLWEDEFYEDGVEIAKRIEELAATRPSIELASLAMEARHKANLRHVPLLLLKAMVKKESTLNTQTIKRHDSMVAYTISEVITRADELAEFVALYWKDGKRPLSAQMKKGLARAFLKFDEYQLAKYNRDGAVKLRDVLFLVHPKPDTPERQEMWDRLATGTLATPDTWEVQLSAGSDKKATFERLLREGKLGYLALLRNLRNMLEAGCDHGLVSVSILERRNGAHRVLPFRYVAAARAAPVYQGEINAALLTAIADQPRFPGLTFVLVDVSGSMKEKLSAKSDLTRMDAAAALAGIINCEQMRVFSFSNRICEGPPHLRGMAMVEGICNSQEHGGTYLGQAIARLNDFPHDRLIVLTDEQAHGANMLLSGWGTPHHLPDPIAKRAYMINVASAKRGVGYGKWTHIDGFSESVLRFIHEFENVGA